MEGSRRKLHVRCAPDCSLTDLLAQASIRLHHLLEVAPHVGRQAPCLDEQIVHAHAQDRRGALDQLVARRLFLFALNARPISGRDAKALGEVVEADALLGPFRPDRQAECHGGLLHPTSPYLRRRTPMKALVTPNSSASAPAIASIAGQPATFAAT